MATKVDYPWGTTTQVVGGDSELSSEGARDCFCAAGIAYRFTAVLV